MPRAKRYSKGQRRRIEAAKERGRSAYSGWLKRKIDRSLSQSASTAAKLPWLDQPKPKPSTSDPKWDTDDLEQLDLPADTLDALRQVGLNSCSKAARCEALGKLPSHLDQPAISAALTTWMANSAMPCSASRPQQAAPSPRGYDVRRAAP